MTQLKKIAILGSTGSIGTQSLDVIASHSDLFEATALMAGSNVDALIEQAVAHRPHIAVIADESKYRRLKDVLQPLGIETAAGTQAILDAMGRGDIDQVVTATVGYSGLAPTLHAIMAGKDIALANKETLVVAGDIVTAALSASPSRVIPVDSEHSAIYQCLQGEDRNAVKRLIITASGGPFRNLDASRLEQVTVKEALNHPNWAMGAKITIDSATMVNKSFEIIEARWLFDIEPERIIPVVHPQSIIHSMVEFNDGAIKAQLGTPDMRLPIRYALGDTQRLTSPDAPLTLEAMSHLDFMQPDYEKFPGLKLGHEALRRGGNSACIINAANEIAVAAFLSGRIGFTHIYRLIELMLDKMPFIAHPSYNDYVETNAETRRLAQSLVDAGTI